jgi:endoglucanase
VNCAGHTIAPAGQSAYRMEVQFKVGVADGGTWDPSNDPSYVPGTAVNSKVPLYEAGTRIWGQEPATPTPSPTP